jgi:HPt (histidine-containing phosphotransfer) domain-containing protein
MAKLAAALAAGNRAQVGLLAHSAKGAGAMVCADRYAAVAAALEEKAASAPAEVLERLGAQLQRAYEQFDALLTAVPPPPSSPAPRTSPARS